MRRDYYSAPDVSLLAGVRGLMNLLVTPREAWRVERTQWRQVRSHRALNRLGILRYFEGYPAHAIPPQYDDLLGLYQLVMQRRPSVILEIGGGYSTFVFAEAARRLADESYDVHIHSVDTSLEWQQIQKDHLPPALGRFVSFHHAPATEVEWNGQAVSKLESLPVASANLVYVDGGSVRGNKRPLDVVLLERTAPDDYSILVDGRDKAVVFLKGALTRRYHVGPGPNGTQTLFAPIP